MTLAVQIDQPGGPEQMKLVDVQVGAPGPGEIRIRHHAIGLNFIDVYQRSGVYPLAMPLKLGMEAAGVVEAVGEGVRHLRVGDRAAYASQPPGSYCEVRVMPAKCVCVLPDDIGFDTGAAMAAVLDGPRLLNEFGASRNPLDATLVTRFADEQFVSWMYWHQPAGIAGLDSDLPDEVETQIVRAYPQATAGTPRSLSFDPITGAFQYRYTPDPAIEAPTSIVVPARAYPAGYDVVVEHGTVTSAPQSGRLTVVADASGSDVVVKVTRR